MKFAALLVSATSALVLGLGGAPKKYTPPSGYYYDAGKLDGILGVNANVNVDVDLDVDIDLFKRVCTRGNYGGYDCYRCTRRLSPRLDVCLNVDLNINLGLGLGVNLAGIHL